MPSRLLGHSERLFDYLRRRWETLATQRGIATSLVVIFVAGLLLVEVRRLNWLPLDLASRLPSNHFEAILFPKTYQKYGHLIRSHGPYIVTGRVQCEDFNTVLIADMVDLATKRNLSDKRETIVIPANIEEEGKP